MQASGSLQLKNIMKLTGSKSAILDSAASCDDLAKPATVRREIRTRLNNGSLYSLDECKLVLKQLLTRLVVEAHKDFEQLLFLDEYLGRLSFDKPDFEFEAVELLSTAQLLESMNKGVVTETAPPPKGSDATAQAMLEKVVREIHYSILKVANLALSQRRDRLRLVKSMLADIEKAGELRDLDGMEFEPL